jgi:hypothetical protein
LSASTISAIHDSWTCGTINFWKLTLLVLAANAPSVMQVMESFDVSKLKVDKCAKEKE